MNETLQLTHTKVGDLPRWLGLLIKRDIPGIYDRESKAHGLHTDLSGGWRLAIWIAFILTESDHPKYKVEDWVERHADLLSPLTGQQIRAAAFNHKRLSRRLWRLSKPARGEPFEAALWDQSGAVYQLLSPGVGHLYSAPCDATTVSGDHQIHDDGLLQRGHSKDHRPDLAQLKLMTVAAPPHGQLIATAVVSGQTAEDGLSLPLMARVRPVFGCLGVRYVGDSKMAARAAERRIRPFAAVPDGSGFERRAGVDARLQRERRAHRSRLRIEERADGAVAEWRARRTGNVFFPRARAGRASGRPASGAGQSAV